MSGDDYEVRIERELVTLVSGRYSVEVTGPAGGRVGTGATWTRAGARWWARRLIARHAHQRVDTYKVRGR